MKMLAIDLMSMIVGPLWDMALLSELLSGVPLNARMIFYTSELSAIEKDVCNRSFQLLAFALLIATFTFWEKSMHSCQFLCIVCRIGCGGRSLLGRVDRSKAFSFLLNLFLPIWNGAEDVKMLLNRDICIKMLIFSGICSKHESISFLKQDQSMPLWYNLDFLGITA